MSALTPQQMRVLADRFSMSSVNDLQTDYEVEAALRTAADQLEAVRALANLYDRSGKYDTARLIREAAADTAPQDSSL